MFLKSWFLLLLSAVLQVLAFHSPNLYWLGWVALVPWLLSIFELSDKPRGLLHAAVQGWIVGALWYLGTCYWIYTSMRLHGGLGPLASGFVLALFCLYVGLYHALFGALALILVRRFSGPPLAMLLATAWVATELARSRVTAFPWDLLGYAQTDNLALTHLASWTGVFGLSFAVALASAALAVGVFRKISSLTVAGLAFAIALQCGMLLKSPAATTDHIAILLQQNLPLEAPDSWTRSYFDATISGLVQASEPEAFRRIPESRGKLIVWPESPAPFFLSDRNFLRWMDALADDAHAYIIAGTIATTNSARPTEQALYNSAALFSPDGTLVRRYDKVHLVPFGEYVPLVEYLQFAKDLTKEVGTFSRGAHRTLLEAGPVRAGTFICYESVFPDEVRLFSKSGANVLVNISNDGWFGHSGAALQHLRMVRMRAIENRRWVLRATNSGITSVIDPLGRVTQAAPIDVRYALEAHYALASTPQTFYTVHRAWFAYSCAILTLAALFFPRRSRAAY